MRRTVFTPHAKQRMDEMGLTPADVCPVIFDAEVSYGANPAKYGPDAHTAQRGNLAVGYRCDGDTTVVLSVLRRTQEQYVRGA